MDIQLTRDIMILQRYLSPKVTKKGVKFHFRVMALAVGDCNVYVYDEIRVLLATIPYTENDENHYEIVKKKDRSCMHFTNASVNEKHPTYDKGLHNQECNAFCQAQGLSSTIIVQDITTCIRTVFENACANRRRFFTLPNCYELFGFDFMLDRNDRLWLLEINPDPSPRLFQLENWKGVVGNPLKEIPESFTRVYSKTLSEGWNRLKALRTQNKK